MFVGGHVIIYSRNAEADRAFLRDTLKLPNVDAGGGWLIFGLPPSEVAVHPAASDSHEFYLMCDDLEAFVTEMKTRSVPCDRIQNERWGSLTRVTLPSGTKLGVYQPKHTRPEAQ